MLKGGSPIKRMRLHYISVMAIRQQKVSLLVLMTKMIRFLNPNVGYSGFLFIWKLLGNRENECHVIKLICETDSEIKRGNNKKILFSFLKVIRERLKKLIAVMNGLTKYSHYSNVL